MRPPLSQGDRGLCAKAQSILGFPAAVPCRHGLFPGAGSDNLAPKNRSPAPGKRTKGRS